jgi:hypothetical protein
MVSGRAPSCASRQINNKSLAVTEIDKIYLAPDAERRTGGRKYPIPGA